MHLVVVDLDHITPVKLLIWFHGEEQDGSLDPTDKGEVGVDETNDRAEGRAEGCHSEDSALSESSTPTVLEAGVTNITWICNSA